MANLDHLKKLIRQERYMLDQFIQNQRTIINRLLDQKNGSSEALDSLKADLGQSVSWSEVNRVELALVDHYDDITLETEWQRRLAEVTRLPGNLVGFYGEQANQSNPDKLRALLSRLITDIQWSRESKRVIRYNEGLMRKRTVYLFLFAFIFFFMPTILRVLLGIEFDNLRMYYLFTAASSGILGASFSQLTSISSRTENATLDQVRGMSQLGYVVARALVGAGAGLIMFYLIQSGLLDGAFFPQFIHLTSELASYQAELTAAAAQGMAQPIESKLAVGTLARPAQGMSLLIVWCMIAGFSEKMIPGILNNKAKQAEESSKK